MLCHIEPHLALLHPHFARSQHLEAGTRRSLEVGRSREGEEHARLLTRFHQVARAHLGQQGGFARSAHAAVVQRHTASHRGEHAHHARLAHLGAGPRLKDHESEYQQGHRGQGGHNGEKPPRATPGVLGAPGGFARPLLPQVRAVAVHLGQVGHDRRAQVAPKPMRAQRFIQLRGHIARLVDAPRQFRRCRAFPLENHLLRRGQFPVQIGLQQAFYLRFRSHVTLSSFFSVVVNRSLNRVEAR